MFTVDMIVDFYKQGKPVTLMREERDALIKEIIFLRESSSVLQREVARLERIVGGGRTQTVTVIEDEALL